MQPCASRGENQASAADNNGPPAPAVAPRELAEVGKKVDGTLNGDQQDVEVVSSDEVPEAPQLVRLGLFSVFLFLQVTASR